MWRRATAPMLFLHAMQAHARRVQVNTMLAQPSCKDLPVSQIFCNALCWH